MSKHWFLLCFRSDDLPCVSLPLPCRQAGGGRKAGITGELTGLVPDVGRPVNVGAFHTLSCISQDTVESNLVPLALPVTIWPGIRPDDRSLPAVKPDWYETIQTAFEPSSSLDVFVFVKATSQASTDVFRALLTSHSVAIEYSFISPPPFSLSEPAPPITLSSTLL
jgi:hypothetical protein